jgi:hypothetical protein
VREAQAQEHGSKVLAEPKREGFKRVWVVNQFGEDLSRSGFAKAVFPKQVGIETRYRDRCHCRSNGVRHRVRSHGSVAKGYDRLRHVSNLIGEPVAGRVGYSEQFHRKSSILGANPSKVLQGSVRIAGSADYLGECGWGRRDRRALANLPICGRCAHGLRSFNVRSGSFACHAQPGKV